MNNKAVWILLIIIFFIAGAAGSYFFMKYFDSRTPNAQQKEVLTEQRQGIDSITIRLYLPKKGKIEMTERSIQRRGNSISNVEGIIEEFFKNGTNDSDIPENVKLLGIYKDQDQIVYIDLSDEIRRNFHGDSLDEYILLKAVYETLSANMQDFQDLKILIEGKETDTLGGHFIIRYPLKGILGSGTGYESRSS